MHRISGELLKSFHQKSKTTCVGFDGHPTKGDCGGNAVTPVTSLCACHRLALPIDRHAPPGALLRAMRHA
ncbi:hypothetical protein CBM2623_B170182 [Cupriavidus taiwanensis]|nr:hypothetical protein CBM2608_B140253 [Cupriavidus taiwanensis]SPA33112.1 hypothetical protein CBM2623_B170182 [Cupriavidus taiwanensis]